MHKGNSSFRSAVRSLASGGLGVLLLLGGAGCVSEFGDGAGEDDVTTVTSAFTSTFNGHTYIFSTNTATWFNAQQSCLSQGMHLVSIHDTAENNFVFGVANNAGQGGGGNWWLGYNDRSTEGLWAWESGQGQGYVNWNNGEPNNSGDEDCLMYAPQLAGKWNDSNCNNSFKFICESGTSEVPVAPGWFNIGNTNSDTVNYNQFAIDLTFNHLATIGTCNQNDTGDTYIRLMRPNGTQLVENDDACGPTFRQSQVSINVPQTGTYVLRGGCYQNLFCTGFVTIQK